jgi:hypothetical protein
MAEKRLVRAPSSVLVLLVEEVEVEEVEEVERAARSEKRVLLSCRLETSMGTVLFE